MIKCEDVRQLDGEKWRSNLPLNTRARQAGPQAAEVARNWRSRASAARVESSPRSLWGGTFIGHDGVRVNGFAPRGQGRHYGSVIRFVVGRGVGYPNRDSHRGCRDRGWSCSTCQR